MLAKTTIANSSVPELTERQRIEAAVYDARVRATAASLRDEDLLVDPLQPPFPNREHVEFLSFALGRLPHLSGSDVLEVGSGTGSLSVYLALRGANVTGIDVSEENAALALRRATANGVADRARFRAVPIEVLDEPDATYDFILGNQVLHHFELEQALLNIRRLLRPGGRALFCEPVLLLPDALRRLRQTRLVKRLLPQRVDTPTERSVSLEDIAMMRRVFPGLAIFPFQFFARVQNFVELDDSWWARLATIDRSVLEHMPALRQFCRFVVVECKQPLAAGRSGAHP